MCLSDCLHSALLAYGCIEEFLDSFNYISLTALLIDYNEQMIPEKQIQFVAAQLRQLCNSAMFAVFLLSRVSEEETLVSDALKLIYSCFLWANQYSFSARTNNFLIYHKRFKPK